MIELDVTLQDTDFEVNVEKYFAEANPIEVRCFARGFLWGFLTPLPLMAALLLILKTLA